MPRPTTRSRSERALPSPGYHSLGQEAAIGLLRSADAVRRHFTHVLEPWGITLQQFNVLRILRGAGPDGLPTLTVAERMIEHTPGITRLLDRLEKQGWVKRQRCSEDRRRVWARITPAGLDLLAELDEPVARADDDAVAALSDTQKRQLIRISRRLAND